MELLKIRIYGNKSVLAIAPDFIKTITDMNLNEIKKAGFEVITKNDKITVIDPGLGFVISYTQSHPTVKNKIISFKIGNIELVILIR